MSNDPNVIDIFFCAFVIVIIMFVGWGILYCYDIKNIRLTNEYNKCAEKEGWDTLNYHSQISADDVSRAIILSKMHIKPTPELMSNTKPPHNNYVYLRTGR